MRLPQLFWPAIGICTAMTIGAALGFLVNEHLDWILLPFVVLPSWLMLPFLAYYLDRGR